MLIGNLNIPRRIEKSDILNEIRQSERLACLRTFSKLFKRDRSEDAERDYVINMTDLRNGMKCLNAENLKDYNLDTLIAILEDGQKIEGLKDAEFADLFSDYLIIDPSKQVGLTNNIDDDGLKYVFDDLKTPGKETIDIKRLTELYTAFAKGDSDPKYNEEQLKRMIDVTSVRGDEVTYEDFRKLFLAEVF